MFLNDYIIGSCKEESTLTVHLNVNYCFTNGRPGYALVIFHNSVHVIDFIENFSFVYSMFKNSQHFLKYLC